MGTGVIYVVVLLAVVAYGSATFSRPLRDKNARTRRVPSVPSCQWIRLGSLSRNLDGHVGGVAEKLRAGFGRSGSRSRHDDSRTFGSSLGVLPVRPVRRAGDRGVRQRHSNHHRLGAGNFPWKNMDTTRYGERRHLIIGYGFLDNFTIAKPTKESTNWPYSRSANMTMPPTLDCRSDPHRLINPRSDRRTGYLGAIGIAFSPL